MITSISIKGVGRTWTMLFSLVLLSFAWMRIGIAQEHKADLNELINETQKMSDDVDEMTLVWWIPEEYWQLVLAEDETMTDASIEEVVEVVRPYTLIVAVDGVIGLFGGVTYKSEDELRSSVRIVDNQGTSYSPLSEDKIDPDTRNLLSMMRPVLVNMLGPLGQNMHFLVFPAKTKKGQDIAKADKEGRFSVKMGQREFKWRLPLSSLLPPKICPKCGEKLSGAYKFCPWCGTELPEPNR